MPSTARVTVTLPAEVVAQIDRLDRNRSHFITVAVEHELEKRRREALLLSVENPHVEAIELAAEGLAAWGAALPSGDDGLGALAAGMAVRWEEGRGWVEEGP